MQDPRVAKLPIVASAPQFRAYAGHPLVDEHGACIGTFCVFDLKPREFAPADRQTLIDLAALAQRELLSDQLTNAHAALTSKLGMARREALMDPLTHLWNRRGASVLLKAAFASADQRGTPLALALLDLDNFKRINDTRGHQAGDEVLRRVASRLLSTVRGDDAICRLGGDEFLVLMADTDAAIASRVAERIRRAITDTPCPRAMAQCRQRQRRLHGSPAARHDGRRRLARARRPSVDGIEGRRPQSRSNDELRSPAP